MYRHPVKSSNLASVGYDEAAKTLHVEFKSGAIYEYPDVTAKQHEALMLAESHGKHFNKHFRSQKAKKIT